MEESDDLEDQEESERLSLAFVCFTHHFQEYVKEMDFGLWKRAVDYSMTFTDIDGVKFTYADDKGNTGSK